MVISEGSWCEWLVSSYGDGLVSFYFFFWFERMEVKNVRFVLL